MTHILVIHHQNHFENLVFNPLHHLGHEIVLHDSIDIINNNEEDGNKHEYAEILHGDRHGFFLNALNDIGSNHGNDIGLDQGYQ
jgi:hypothetical protein